MFWKKYRLLMILLAVAIAIRIFASFPGAVEEYYSQGIYPVLASVQRSLLGWIPFSIGDFIYAFAVIWLIKGLVQFIRKLIQRDINRSYGRRIAKRTVLAVLWVYIIFNGLWGLNYNRLGIAKQLNLEVTVYSTQELVQVVQLTITKLHQLDSAALSRRELFAKKSFLFDESVASYKQVVNRFPVLEYNRPSVKPSLYSYLGNYLGYSGYYNPFTGEAQVNTTVPLVLQPFVTCHEIGHQLGYAKENEANFAAFLSARASQDEAVRYSIYFDLYIYAARNLRLRDSTLARGMQMKLPSLALKDLRDLRSFYDRYENLFEPVIRAIYGEYLRANEQPEGILSYDEVLGWVIAYYRKYREI